MDKIKFTHVCAGTCAARITRKDYGKGLHVCGTKGCTHVGKPFKKVAN
ncbi:MAG: hypothetical protein V1708_01750 [Candidatus Micrarchaeota archaeon]